MTDLRATILAMCDDITVSVSDLRLLVNSDRPLTDDEVLLALHVLDGMFDSLKRVRGQTLGRWAETRRRSFALETWHITTAQPDDD